MLEATWILLTISGTICIAFGFFAAFKSMFVGRPAPASPSEEKLASSAKSKYRLLKKHVYLVEEPKPRFAFLIFNDVLKGRCFDCENDQSFTCESLDCAQCQLPCPCRPCEKHKTRSQGLIITNQHPIKVRREHFIQTTPILWLSSVPSQDAMDPAKLSMLTDYLVNFMESSENGVILVDGLEYLMTSNDFSRMLRAVDKWTEAAMVSSTRIVMSADRNAFNPKELAYLERDKEIVRPDAKEPWRIIPERI